MSENIKWWGRPNIPVLARNENESIDDYLERKEKKYNEIKEERVKHNAKVQEFADKKFIEKMKERYPNNKVTLKGVYFICAICGKHSVKKYFGVNIDIKEDQLICEDCKSEQKLRKEYPNNKIKGNKIQFICEHCGKSYWWKPYREMNNRFCSKYCKYCSTLKNPPKWNKEEWEKLKEWEDKTKEKGFHGFNWDRFNSVSDEQYKFSLGSPSEDKKQSVLFKALEEYFDCIENPNHRLSAIQNVYKNLKTIGNECHVQICNSEEETERKLISHH